ncbi:hypothetical protein NDU88_005165 [Pleurodeles waltl]|uniref:Uncharacterized protein n=1 Tax=Pleurodeles waltl TaxID=8319 RepID=A0AAV7LKQ7_PLEWA|nr:hypothetical protein NDU88_005165 [Pleurodeles waltl]
MDYEQEGEAQTKQRLPGKQDQISLERKDGLRSTYIKTLRQRNWFGGQGTHSTTARNRSSEAQAIVTQPMYVLKPSGNIVLGLKSRSTAKTVATV